MTTPVSSRWSSRGTNAVISLDLASTATCPRTTPVSWSTAATRCTGRPSGLRPPRALLASTARQTSPCSGWRTGARVASHAVRTASSRSGSTTSTTRRIVAAEGAPRPAPNRRRTCSSRSATHSAIARYDRAPPMTAARANPSTTESSNRRPCRRRGSGRTDSTSTRSHNPPRPTPATVRVPSTTRTRDDTSAGMTASTRQLRISTPLTLPPEPSCPPAYHPHRRVPARHTTRRERNSPAALAAGLAPRLAPQGLRVRFGQAIAGRWLRGVSRRRSHLPLQLRDTRILAGDAGLQIHQMRLQRDHQVGELLICWLRHKYILPHQANKSMQTRRPTASNRNRQAQKTSDRRTTQELALPQSQECQTIKEPDQLPRMYPKARHYRDRMSGHRLTRRLPAVHGRAVARRRRHRAPVLERSAGIRSTGRAGGSR